MVSAVSSRVVAIDVSEYRRRADEAERRRRVAAGVRGSDDLVTLPAANRAQGDLERIRPVADAEALRDAAVGGELRLKRVVLRAHDVPAAGEHLIHRRAHRRAECTQLARQVVERHLHVVGFLAGKPRTGRG